jgi:prepilin-type N-terminal cleavage/methylation domain-containing protein
MIYKKQKYKPAFTMIELIMVIIVLGILASFAIPRLDRDVSQEAADSILSNIRYTQHLALVDDKHLFNDPTWQRRYWKIMFATCQNGDLFYRIGSDDNSDGNGMFTQTEAAIDPINGKPFFMANNDANCDADTSVSNNIFLTKRFGVTAIDTTACNNVAHIGFDHLGRPHQSYGASAIPNYASYLNAQCTFTFTLSDGNSFSISIAPETGYAQIVGQNAS